MQQKDFDKLPQLDRIEFRQRLEIIKSTYESSQFCSLLYIFVLLTFLSSILVAVLGGIDGLNIFVNNLVDSMFFIGVIFVFTIIVDMAFIIKKNKAVKELFDKYFKIKVEVNKSGRKKTK